MSRTVILICLLAAAAVDAAVADPVSNGSLAERSVGWFDGNGLTCPQICERHRAVAEGEKNTLPPGKTSYVCKIRRAEEGPYLWLFGTQFGDRPACYSTDRDIQGSYSKVFYCLCVKRTLRIGELAPASAPGRGD